MNINEQKFNNYMEGYQQSVTAITKALLILPSPSSAITFCSEIINDFEPYSTDSPYAKGRCDAASLMCAHIYKTMYHDSEYKQK